MISNLRQYFRQESSAAIVGAGLLALLLGITLVVCESKGGVRNDVELYYTYSLQIVQGKLPYRDFPVEYPPLALLPILLPQWINFVTSYSYLGYLVFFSVQNFLIAGTIGHLVLKIAALQQLPRTAAQILLTYGFLLVLNAPLVLWRYDIFCALLTIWALWLILTDQPLLAGIALGLGIAAKLYPILLVPLFIIHCCAQRRYTATLQVLLGSAIVPLLLLVVLLNPIGLDPLFSFVSYHKLRGLQVETLPSGILLLIHKLGGFPANSVLNYGAFHLESPATRPVLQWLPLVASAGLMGTLISYVSRLKGQQNVTRSLSGKYLVLYILATLLVLLSTNKVFSPQYLIWLLPFVLLMPTRQIFLFSVISVLSFFVYPVLYGSLLIKSLFPILILNLRNGLLVLLALKVFRTSSYRAEVNPARPLSRIG